MTTNFIVANTRLEYDWSSFFSVISTLPYFTCDDYDLKSCIEGIALKSYTGKIEDLLRYKSPEKSEDYSYTGIYYAIPILKRLVDFFEVNTTRIRIFKQRPGVQTPFHLDYNNDNNYDKDLIRIWTLLNDNKNKEFLFGFRYADGTEEFMPLKQGQSVIFDPDTAFHSVQNNSNNHDRYSLLITCNPNNWLKNFAKENRTFKID